MAKSDLPNANVVGSGNLTSELSQYNYLYSLVPRTTSGDITFTSASSNITYATISYSSGVYANQGQNGMLSILQAVLANYLVTSSNFNNKLDNPYVVATGTANTYAVTLSPIPTAYTDGMIVITKINITSTGASTINVNILGAKAIVNSLGNAISSGDLLANIIYTMIYDATNNRFIIQGTNGINYPASQSATANTVAVRDANGNVVSNLPISGQNSNLLFNSSARLQLTGWIVDTGTAWSTGYNGYGIDGQFVSPNIVTATGILSILRSSYISLIASQIITLKSLVNVNALTAGAAYINVAFYDSSHVLISSVDGNQILPGGGIGISTVTATAPVNTAYCTARLVLSTTAVGQAFFYHIKLESGSYPTTYSDDNTLNTLQYGSVLPLLQSVSSGNKVQSGSNGVAVTTAGTAVIVTVTFPVAFTTAPKIAIGVTNATGSATAGYINVVAVGATTTTVSVYVNSYAVQTINFDWIAIGM